ncbi:unnamed protein product [Prorocentrum cordatum]|uniref:Uncharacterized protein n=1 Tax=Prorocentrum cordatum TaxID=2364126 RepID=A0ABN9RCZ2_9DINO|nr:unnamed protein product [Polarella glacialis]
MHWGGAGPPLRLRRHLWQARSSQCGSRLYRAVLPDALLSPRGRGFGCRPVVAAARRARGGARAGRAARQPEAHLLRRGGAARERHPGRGGGREWRRAESGGDRGDLAVHVVAGCSDGSAKIWSAGSGECLRTLEGHRDQVTSVTFSPDGQEVLTASDFDDCTAKVWSASSGECLRTMEGPPGWRVVGRVLARRASGTDCVGRRHGEDLVCWFCGVSPHAGGRPKNCDVGRVFPAVVWPLAC